MAGFPAEYGLKPALLPAGPIEASKEPFCLGVGHCIPAFIWLNRRSPSSAKASCISTSAAAATAARAKGQRRQHVARPVEVKIGDAVVHEQHGIGRYMGRSTSIG